MPFNKLRYTLCNSCRKSFTSTTNTFFYSSKKSISVRYKYIEYLIHDEALKDINIKQKVKKVYQFCINSQVDFIVKYRYDA